MKDGIYPDISNHDYHHQPDYAGLSASGIKAIMRSPAHFQVAQASDTPTPAMIFGSAAHTFLLQPELEEVICEPQEINKRTKEGRKAYATFQAENEGKIIVTVDTFATLTAMRETLLAHATARMLLEQGQAEQSVFWQQERFGFTCKCRPDFTVPDLNILIDYKTTTDASPEGFAKALVNLGYPIQAAWYCQGMQQVTGEEWAFLFIAQEKSPPYSVAVYRVSSDVFKLGQKDINQAIKIYNECLASGVWQAYPDQILTIKLPRWARSEHARIR